MRVTTTTLCSLLLQGAIALNVGPEYSHPIEGQSSRTSPIPSSIKQIADLDVDLPFSQPVTFAHLEWQRCLAAAHNKVCGTSEAIRSMEIVWTTT